MSITVRPAILPQDYVAISKVLTAENPNWPRTPEDLAYDDAVRDPALYYAVFVAESEGETREGEPQVVGVATIGHDRFAHREGKFKLDIRVPPGMQGQGIGKLLYTALVRHSEPLAPRELITEVWAAHPRAVRFVTERGFAGVWRRIDWSLASASFDFAPYAGLEERLRGQGVEVKTYAELANDPERLKKLYELDKALWLDVPYGEPVMMANRTQEQFAQTEVQVAKFLPDACFIAILDGQYMGYSNLTKTGDYYDTDMTGVLPAYRGRGIATLLKLYGIRYARTHGERNIWTVNDSVNTSMMSLNEKLGFQRAGAIIRFKREIG